MAARVPIELLDRIRPLEVDEYHSLIESGTLTEDEHVELLEGVIVTMAPQGPAHANVIERLNRLLLRALDDSYRVRPQLPITVRPRSEPEPDFAILPAGGSMDEHPATALLVIEVAVSSLAIDRATKQRIYASAGIAEYWIADVTRAAIEVYLEPDAAAGRYQSLRTVGREATLVSTSVPTLSIALASVFDLPA